MDAKVSGSSLKQYYVAVGTREAKVTTLVELLLALEADNSIAVAICCGSRDSLDEVVSALAATCKFMLFVLHADLTPKEQESQVQRARTLAGSWSQASEHAAGSSSCSSTVTTSGGSASSSFTSTSGYAGTNPYMGAGWGSCAVAPSRTRTGADPFDSPGCPRSLLLVCTDVCLRALGKEVLPLGLPLLLQYDLPGRKETYQRRLASVFGGGRGRRGARNIVVDFVVAGELPVFRSLERYSTSAVQEMPVHVPDIFTA